MSKGLTPIELADPMTGNGKPVYRICGGTRQAEKTDNVLFGPSMIPWEVEIVDGVYSDDDARPDWENICCDSQPWELPQFILGAKQKNEPYVYGKHQKEVTSQKFLSQEQWQLILRLATEKKKEMPKASRQQFENVIFDILAEPFNQGIISTKSIHMAVTHALKNGR